MTAILERPPHKPAADRSPSPRARPRTSLSGRSLLTTPPDEFTQRGYTPPPRRIREFYRLSARQGWNPRSVMMAAGLEATSLTQPCQGMTRENAVAAVRYLRSTTGDEFLGVGPQPVCRDTLRALAHAVASAATLHEALTRLEQFAPVFGGLPRMRLTQESGLATLSFDLKGFDQTNSIVVDTVLAVAHRSINWAMRHPLRLVHVSVPYPKPRGETDHDVVFGVPVVYAARQAALAFVGGDLALPVMRRPNEIETFLADVPCVLLSEIEFYSTYTERVRAIIRRSLGDRICSADEIGSRLGISRQTLRRRLHDEGTSVSAIRDEVLRTAALESLAQGSETVSALALRLGFSEPSAFTRAFRRWTGVSPTEFVRRSEQSTPPRRLSVCERTDR